ncbi:MAG TPA: cytochrome c [Stellaceae bacterium]|nr:cytochrome c [Stellaceae bacterium]
MRKRIFVVALAGAVAALGAAARAQDHAAAGNAKAGEREYRAVGCWECHGTEGQGGAITGPRLADTKLPYEAFLQQLRVPSNAMPPYEPAVLSNADAANIYAFLKSLPPAQSPKDIPLLNE